MNTRNNNASIFLFSSVLFIYILAWLLQTKMLIHWDVTWLVRAAERFVNGGNYVDNFFEPSPPLILYLSLPVVYLVKYLGFSLITITRLYLFALTIISLCLCYPLMQRLFLTKDAALKNIFFLVIVFTFVIQPVREFGQRDYLLTVFSLPYVLLQAANLRGDVSTRLQRAVIGLFGALGFGIKPYFIFLPILTELYLLYAKQNLLYWVRTEVMVVVGFLLVYVCVSVYLFPGYFTVIVPFALHFYHSGASSSLIKLMSEPACIFTILSTLTYFLLPKHNPYQPLALMLLIALIATLASYLAQRMLLYYHLIPAFAFALLLLTLAVGTVLQYSCNTYTYFKLWIIATLFYTFLYYNIKVFWSVIVITPLAFFAYYAVLLTALFYFAQKQKNWWKVICALAATFSICVICFYMIRYSSLANHQFLLINLLFMLCFGLFIANDRTPKLVGIFTSLAVIIVFSYPWYRIHWELQLNTLHKFDRKILSGLQDIKINKVFFLMTTTDVMGLLVNYHHATLASRFPLLWMVPALVEKEVTANNAEVVRNKKFLIDMLAADIRLHQPDLVLVELNPSNFHLKDRTFEYLPYLLTNAAFASAWRDYHFVKNIILSNRPIIAVYVRNS